MELKRNVQMTAEEKTDMADKAIEMMVEDKDNKYVVTTFCGEAILEPRLRKTKHFRMDVVHNVVEVPFDVVDCVVAKLKEKGYFVWHTNWNREIYRYDVHRRQIKHGEGRYL